MMSSGGAVRISVDGAVLSASEGEMLIAACERNGVYIPRFCYHPRMESVGMCRMCLVEVDTGRGPALQPSCMVPVADGMEVITCSEAAEKAQDGVLEFLLLNHPLDCPVCDKGGECPLQDQTMAYGPGESRFVEEKRHFPKPIAISNTVYLDRERCILCDRCTRFADQVAGDPLIHFMGRGSHSEVNVFPDEAFTSYFSGNTVQICPVGALTAVPYRFKARPWDLTEAISTAWVDSVGARVCVQASRNRVLRLLGVDADAVNWGWLSDKERFAFEALNSDDRLLTPLIRREAACGSDDGVVDGSAATDGERAGRTDVAGAPLVSTTWREALIQVTEALDTAEPERIGVLGGARLTNEAQYAWAKLAKGVLGTDNVDAQLDDGLDPELVLGLPRATIDDACRPGSTVLLLGPDPKEEMGSLYLRLRHAVTRDAVTLVEIQPCAGGLSDLAAYSLRPRPGETAGLVRSLMDAASLIVSGGVGDQHTDSGGGTGGGDVVGQADGRASKGVSGIDIREIEQAAKALAVASDGVTVILGRPSLAEPAETISEAAAALTELPSVRFLSALRRGNVHGSLDMGLVPGMLPGRRRLLTGSTSDESTSDRAEEDPLIDLWPRLPEATGLDARGILTAAADGEIDVLVLLAADPINDFSDRGLALRGLFGAACVVAVDMFVNDSAALAADVVLAAAGPTESDGTFTNLEGRISRMAQKVTPPGTARADWAIAAELATRLGSGQVADSGFESPHAIRTELTRVSRIHKLLAAIPVSDSAGVDAVGQVSGLSGVSIAAGASEPVLDPVEGALLVQGDACDAVSVGVLVNSGTDQSDGLRLVATRTMYDDGMMLRHCPSSQGLSRPAAARVHPVELKRLGIAAGSDVRISSDSGSLDAALVADTGVPEGSLAVAWLAPGAPANALIAADAPFTVVGVTAL